MLIMKLGRNAALLKKVLVIVLCLAILILIFAFINGRYINKKTTGSDTPSNNQLKVGQQKYASTLATQGNYEQAEDNYIAAATLASADGKTKEALDIMDQAKTKIPEQKLSWRYYDTLSGLARRDNNKTLEVESLKKDLAKAQQTNSGASQSTIDTINKRLAELGAGK